MQIGRRIGAIDLDDIALITEPTGVHDHSVAAVPPDATLWPWQISIAWPFVSPMASARPVLRRVGTLALGMTAIATVVGIATFATGLWIFDGSRPTWVLIGGALCAVPIGAALLAWFYVRRTVKVAPALVGDVRTLLDEPHGAADVLINYDTGERLTTTARSFGTLRPTLRERRKQLPALYAGVRAITSVPGLAAIALLGTLAVGALGTILLIGGLIEARGADIHTLDLGARFLASLDR